MKKDLELHVLPQLSAFHCLPPEIASSVAQPHDPHQHVLPKQREGALFEHIT